MSLWGNYPLTDEYRAKVIAARMGLPEDNDLSVKTEQTEDRFSVSMSVSIPMKQPKRKPTKLL